MKTRSTFLFTICCVLLILGFVVGLSVIPMGEPREVRDARFAAEGQAAVEAFLQTHTINELDPFEQRDLGAFKGMRGAGFVYPVWNIQGFHFLDLRRRVDFENGSRELRIIVTEGRVTNPGSTLVGTPHMQGEMVYVSHPELVP